MNTATDECHGHRSRKLDSTDLQIVRLLHHDGRITQERISRAIHLSRPAVHERIKRMEEKGVIVGYRARIAWNAVGLGLTTFIWLRTSGGKLHDVAEAIVNLSSPETLVEECHLVTGEWCLLLKVRTASTTTLQELIDRLREMPRIRNTMTTVVMSSAEDSGCHSESAYSFDDKGKSAW